MDSRRHENDIMFSIKNGKRKEEENGSHFEDRRIMAGKD